MVLAPLCSFDYWLLFVSSLTWLGACFVRVTPGYHSIAILDSFSVVTDSTLKDCLVGAYVIKYIEDWREEIWK